MDDRTDETEIETRCVRFDGERDVTVATRPVPEPGTGEVLIETDLTLVSTGTELTHLTRSYPEDSRWSTTYPFYPGYNNVGRVVAAGDGVEAVAEGDRVATYSGHQAHVVADAADCRPIPDGVADEPAVYFTIAEIVMNGIRRGRLTWGETVAVYGLGLLGQIAVRIARLAGAETVVGLDVASDRLGYLPEGPAVTGVDPGVDDWMDRFEAATGGRSADVVYEVTGNPDAIPGEFDVLRDQGRLVVLSSPRGSTEFDFHSLCHAPGYEIIGAHNRTHPTAGDPDDPWTQHRHAELFFGALADDRLSVGGLTSHRRPYADAPDLYDLLLEDRSQALGVVLEW